MIEYAWLLLVLPALGAIINLVLGSRLSKSLIGWIASIAVALSFVVAVAIFVQMLGLPAEERSTTIYLWNWIHIGDLSINAALLIDQLSIIMALVISGVGTLIHIYANSYMHEDERVQRFFVYLNFFVFAMMILVLSDSFAGMFVGWEGVGLASYLLIGFWFDKKDDLYGWYADAGKKAFIVNRVGDFGMLVAMMAIWAAVGTLTFNDVFHEAEAGLITAGAATIICLGLLLGATGKSAQIPLFVWLPDAMAGPTPVSALIHAATMVTAGIYMIVRTNVLWHLAPNVSELAAWIGALTAILGATVAIVQTDLKKVLAYSTVSQLGFMMLAVGVGAYGAAIFHLVAHAFFKALLFLGAGSVMHGLHGETDMRKMGGLRAHMRTTWITMLIGAMALAGIPLMSGYFSKDAIMLGVLGHSIPLYAIGMLTALLTSIYAFRMIFLTFHGTPRDKKLVDHAHESPAMMTIPLWILAFLSIVGGVLNLPFVLSLETWLEPIVGHHTEPPLATEYFALAFSAVISLVGLYIAWSYYLKNAGWVKSLANSFKSLEPAMKNAWYFDAFYRKIEWEPLMAAAKFMSSSAEKNVIDGAVNGIGSGISNLGERARKLQNGFVPTYALSIFIGVTVVVLYFVIRYFIG